MRPKWWADAMPDRPMKTLLRRLADHVFAGKNQLRITLENWMKNVFQWFYFSLLERKWSQRPHSYPALSSRTHTPWDIFASTIQANMDCSEGWRWQNLDRSLDGRRQWTRTKGLHHSGFKRDSIEMERENLQCIFIRNAINWMDVRCVHRTLAVTWDTWPQQR